VASFIDESMNSENSVETKKKLNTHFQNKLKEDLKDEQKLEFINGSATRSKSKRSKTKDLCDSSTLSTSPVE
jgi:hypothetical protein